MIKSVFISTVLVLLITNYVFVVSVTTDRSDRRKLAGNVMMMMKKKMGNNNNNKKKRSKSRSVILELDARPEGITEGPGSKLYVSQILSGGIMEFDASRNGKSLKGKYVIPPQDDGRQAWGLWYYKGALFVAGGGNIFGGGREEIYVYDVKTGKELVTCQPKAGLNKFGTGFINDVFVHKDNGYAYITDSINSRLMVLDANAAIKKGKCITSSIQLPNAFKPEAADDFGANGIVAYGNGLLVAHEIDGSVYYIDLKTPTKSKSYKQIIANGDAAFADGLTLLDDKLYITQNLPNEIGVFQLSGSNVDDIKAVKIGALTSPLFDTPATSAIYQGYIYSTNSRFAEFEIPEEVESGDNVVGIRNYFDGKCYV